MSLETFASPGLRWGLLLEDHPGATHSFTIKSGQDLGIPQQFGGDKDFCVCTIEVPGHEPTTAWKEVPARGDSNDWAVLQTKTLGRALKKAGYPDDMVDLKALMLWRRRNAEVAALSEGAPLGELAAGPTSNPQPELSAGQSAPAETEIDPGEEPEAETASAEEPDGIEDAVLVPDISTTRNATGEIQYVTVGDT